MPEDLSSLSEDDLQRLLQVIESLERSNFDYLQLEVGGMRVVLGKGNPDDAARLLQGQPNGAAPPAPVPVAAAPTGAAPVSSPTVPTPVPAPAASSPAAGAGSGPAPAAAAVEDGTVVIAAPMMGIFYAQPEPGAPPYVGVGSEVAADTTVALVEVMKMFNAVPAGVAGTVVAVLVDNNELVEYGQPLFRVRPS